MFMVLIHKTMMYLSAITATFMLDRCRKLKFLFQHKIVKLYTATSKNRVSVVYC